MLLYLYNDNNLRKACKTIAEAVSDRMGFQQSKNLVFMKENFVFENEIAIPQKGEIFWDTFCLWKENYLITEEACIDSGCTYRSRLFSGKNGYGRIFLPESGMFVQRCYALFL